MSKTKKIATAVVSVVLASSMCFAFTACSNDSNDSGSTDGGSSGGGTSGLTQSQTRLSVTTDSDGDLSWAEGTTLSMNMGQSSSISIAYGTGEIAESQSVTSIDGNTYYAGSLKPAWQSLSTKLGIGITDNYSDHGGSSSTRISSAINASALGNYAMISGSASEIVEYGTANQAFVDLSMYLEYMPNFKAFLEENPVTYMSLTANTSTGAIYYAPYYDGNDDIEKYEIANKHWIKALLDNDNEGSSVTFADQASAKASMQDSGSTVSTSASVSSFMGTTGSWAIESSNPEDEGATTVTVTVSYDNVLDALEDGNSALAKAVNAVEGVTASTIESGNIVDIQNAAINATEGKVTGAQLLNILRAYIDVAYDVEGEKYDYRSDVFCDYDAAWDVDLLVAFMRCLVTNTSMLSDINLKSGDNYKLVFGLMARQGDTMQRQSDLQSLAGELYGVRGLTSRYEYAYIDSDGTYQDARLDTATYDAMDRLHDMADEGLLYTGSAQSTSNNNGSNFYYNDASTPVTFMMYDYVQTQTSNGGFVAQGVNTNTNVPSDFDSAPLNTPVSKWSDGTTDDDGYTYITEEGTTYKYMRFTESWRSVKNTGFAIPYAYVQNNPDALAACLAIIDYMFSNDGQILMTYGDISTNGNTATLNTDGTYTSNDNGFWYATDVTESVNVAELTETVGDQLTIKDEYASQYFVYEGNVYTDGQYYKGEMQPKVTTAVLQLFYGKTVNGMCVTGSSTSSNPAGGWGASFSYTNFARKVIGSAQPMGYKLQSFEYQMTASCGLAGADIVAAGLVNGTINHVYIDPDDENINGNMWYFISPTTYPLSSEVSSYITSYSTDLDVLFSLESGDDTNLLWSIITYGYEGTSTNSNTNYFSIGELTIACPSNGTAAVAIATDYYAGRITGLLQSSFEDIIEYYDTYIKASD